MQPVMEQWHINARHLMCLLLSFMISLKLIYALAHVELKGNLLAFHQTLLQPHFAAKLCSPQCYQACPNIVDLYFNLALREGVHLPTLCEAQRANPRCGMFQIQSSGAVAGPVSAPGPISAELDISPALAPIPA